MAFAAKFCKKEALRQNQREIKAAYTGTTEIVAKNAHPRIFQNFCLNCEKRQNKIRGRYSKIALKEPTRIKKKRKKRLKQSESQRQKYSKLRMKSGKGNKMKSDFRHSPVKNQNNEKFQNQTEQRKKNNR